MGVGLRSLIHTVKLSDGDRNVILSFFKRMLGGIKKVFNSRDTLPNRFEGIVAEFESAVKKNVIRAWYVRGSKVAG